MSFLRRLFLREPDPGVIEVTHEGIAYRIVVRRMARARRFTLRVRTASRDVVLTLPERSRLSDAKAFAERHGAWIATRLARLPEVKPIAPETSVPLRGAPHAIVHTGKVRGLPCLVGQEIHVGGDPAFTARRVRDFLMREAQRDLEDATRRHAEALGVTFAKVIVRDQTTRWGSCSSTGTISYSWRLILAPPFVLNYLAAHEVAHLREMNHSQRFWRLVRGLDPEMDKAKAWLRAHGSELHRWG